MNMDPKLHQQMLELIYDLLPPDEEAALRARIANDPEVARLFEETEKTAGIFAEAAQLETLESVLPVMGEKAVWRQEVRRPRSTPVPPSSRPSRGPRTSPAFPSRKKTQQRKKGYYLLLSSMAISLLVVTLFGVLSQKIEFARLSNRYLHVRVTGPPYLVEGETNGLTVAVSNILGEPKRAPVQLKLLSDNGERILGHTQQTDQEGKAHFVFNESLDLPEQVQLHITAGEKETEQVQSRIAVLPPVAPTYLTTDKPLYAPGEPLFFRAQTVARGFSDRKKENRREKLARRAGREVNVLLTDPKGDPADPRIPMARNLQMQGKNDTAQGQMQLPSMMAHGAYLLNAIPESSPAGPQARHSVTVDSYEDAEIEQTESLAFPHLMQQQLVLNVQQPEPTNGHLARSSSTPLSPGKRNGLSLNSDSIRGEGSSGGIASSMRPHDLPQNLPEPADTAKKDQVDEAGQTREIYNFRKGQPKDSKAGLPLEPTAGEGIRFQFFPEGGHLVAGLENRVFFQWNPQSDSEDASLETLMQDAVIVDRRQNTVSSEFTTYANLGEFTFIPEASESYFLVYTDQDEVRHSVPLPSAQRGAHIVLSAGLGIFEAEQPIQFHLRSARSNLPLVVTAFQGGIPLAQELLVTREQANPVELSLDESVMGVVRICVFDFSQSPPQEVATRLVFKEPKRFLQLDRKVEMNRYGGGATVRLQVSVENEQHRFTPATLGVSVVEIPPSSAIDPSHRPTLQLWRWYGEAFGPRELEISREWEFLESLDGLSEQKAKLALDLFLGTRTVGATEVHLPQWPDHLMAAGEPSSPEVETSTSVMSEDSRLLGQNDPIPSVLLPASVPPMVFDNLPELKKSYRDHVDRLHARGAFFSRVVTVLGVLGGMSLILLALILNALGMTVGMRSLAAALVVGIACILLCSMLNPLPGSKSVIGNVAFVNHGLGSHPMNRRWRRDFESHLGRTRPPMADHVVPQTDSLRPQDRVAFGAAEKLSEEAAPSSATTPEPEMQTNEPAPESARLREDLDDSKMAAVAPTESAGTEPQRNSDLGVSRMEVEEAMPGNRGNTAEDVGKPLSLQKEASEKVKAESATEENREKKQFFSANKKTDRPRPLSGSSSLEMLATAQPEAKDVPSVMRTLYWNPQLSTDEEGKAEIVFDMPDPLRTFHVVIDATGEDGRIGSLRFRFPLHDDDGTDVSTSP